MNEKFMNVMSGSGKIINISKRLRAVAKLVQGPTVADVGCDGANLAIWLAQNRNFFVYASDLREGPLKKARFNVEKFGLLNKVKLVQAFGLQQIPSLVNEVVVAGLGGEQIEKIVLNCNWLKSAKTRLILQPQSFIASLKQKLCYAGFAIENEVYVVDRKKAYLIFVARFCGVRKILSLKEAVVGSLKAGDEAAKVWVRLQKQKFLRALHGLCCARPTSEVLQKKLQLEEIYSILNNCGVV